MLLSNLLFSASFWRFQQGENPIFVLGFGELFAIHPRRFPAFPLRAAEAIGSWCEHRPRCVPGRQSLC